MQGRTGTPKLEGRYLHELRAHSSLDYTTATTLFVRDNEPLSYGLLQSEQQSLDVDVIIQSKPQIDWTGVAFVNPPRGLTAARTRVRHGPHGVGQQRQTNTGLTRYSFPTGLDIGGWDITNLNSRYCRPAGERSGWQPRGGSADYPADSQSHVERFAITEHS